MRSVHLLLFFFVVVLCITPTFLAAFPSGFVGVTVVGCSCHGPANSATSISIPGRTSPITARPGETLSLSLMVAHTSQSAAGMNVAIVNAAGTNAGTLIAGEGSQLLGSELTHNTPRGMSNGSAVFPFQWTAPSTPGTYTIRAVGNAVNRDGGSGGDAWNALAPFTITVEAAIPTFSISGRILNASGVAVPDVLVSDGTRTATSDAQGNYTISGIPNGTYTIVAARTNWTFAPTTLAVTVNGANVSGQNFTGTRLWAVRGTIVNPMGVPVSDVIVSAGSSTATTDAQGNYTLWLANGTYTIRVARTNWSFSPETLSATVNGADLSGQNFTGRRLWAVRGTIVNPMGVAVPDVAVSANVGGTLSSTATTDAQGNYTLWLANGSYTLVPSRTNWAFSPASQSITIVGADIQLDRIIGSLMSSATLLSVNSSLTLAPNPSSGITTISYNTSSSQRIRYEVYSSLGELVRSFEEERPAGIHRYTLSLQDFPNGVYYCRVATNGATIGTAAIMVQR